MGPLSRLLETFVRRGELSVRDAAGKIHRFGDGGTPRAAIRLTNRRLYWTIALNPELKAAEAYMDGELEMEDGTTVHDLLTVFSVNREGLAATGTQKLMRRAWRGLRRWHQANPLGGAARHARHHYDLSDELYRLFLDKDLNYSCAYFLDPETDTLEAAQAAKQAHIAAKLSLEPGMRVADIGCGWGSLAIYLARTFDVHVTAINVSPEQLAVARARAETAGVADRIDFRLADYRELDGRYDRLVSVGMFEHVGIGHFDEFFARWRALTTPDGYGLLHAIGRATPPGTTGPFFRRYIFPGGYAPALSEVFAAIERQGLWAADAEVLRLHYAWTLRHWRERFRAGREAARALYDERFCRMWEFYLSAAELGFVHGSNMVFQLLLAPARDAVPLRRDFMVEAERPLLSRHGAPV